MLKLSNVSKYYSSQGNVALGLRNVNIEFEKNEFVAIVGESGSGKTTLLNILSGIDSYEEGEMFFDNQETSYFSLSDWEEYRKNNIGFIFQNYNLIESYNVIQNVESVLLLRGVNKKEARQRALEIIDKVGLSKRKRSRAAKLSGGEKQRVVIARAIASDPKILVCDEPTGNLDSENGKQIMALINDVAPGRLVVMVTHDFSLVEPYATRKVRLYDGEVVEDTKLRPKKNDVKEHQAIQVKSPQFLTNLLFSLRNLVMTPKRSLFSLLVYIAITFTIVGVYDSVFLSNMVNSDHSNMYVLTDNRRIVINKYDKKEFSQDELDKIEKITGVDKIYKNDYYLDALFTTFNADVELNFIFIYQSIDQLNEADIKMGRLPIKNNEVVTNRHELLDKKIKYTHYFESREYEVVGITDKYYSNKFNVDIIYGSNLLERDMMLFNVPSYFKIKADGIKLDKGFESIQFEIDNKLDDNNILLNYTSLENEETTIDDIELYLTSYYETKEITGYNLDIEQSFKNTIKLNSNTLLEIMGDKVYQVSIIIEDDYIKNSVVSQLKIFGYRVIDINDFPPSGLSGLLMITETIFKSIIAVVGIIFLYFVSYMILNLVMNSKNRDYSILRILGANRKDLGNILLVENVLMALTSCIITFIGVIIVNNYYSLGVINIIKYRDFYSMFILLMIIIVLASMLSLRFARKMFNTTVNIAIRRD